MGCSYLCMPKGRLDLDEAFSLVRPFIVDGEWFVHPRFRALSTKFKGTEESVTVTLGTGYVSFDVRRGERPRQLTDLLRVLHRRGFKIHSEDVDDYIIP